MTNQTKTQTTKYHGDHGHHLLCEAAILAWECYLSNERPTDPDHTDNQAIRPWFSYRAEFGTVSARHLAREMAPTICTIVDRLREYEQRGICSLESFDYLIVPAIVESICWNCEICERDADEPDYFDAETLPSVIVRNRIVGTALDKIGRLPASTEYERFNAQPNAKLDANAEINNPNNKRPQIMKADDSHGFEKFYEYRIVTLAALLKLGATANTAAFICEHYSAAIASNWLAGVAPKIAANRVANIYNV